MDVIATLGAIFLPLLLCFFICRFLIRWLRKHTTLTFQAIFYALIIFGLLGLLILGGQNLEFVKKDLVEITGRVEKTPAFEKGGKGGPYLKIVLIGQRCEFQSDDFSYRVLRKEDFQNDIHIGDTLTIGYPKREWYDYFGFISEVNGFIHFVTLHSGSKEYVRLEDYNRYRSENHQLSYFFLIVPAGIYIYWFAKRKQGKVHGLKERKPNN